MSPQATVRAQARNALKHNYARAIIAFVTALLPIFMIDAFCSALILGIGELAIDAELQNILSVVLYDPLILIGGILLSPFINGFIRVYYRNGYTNDMDLKDLYYYFEGGRYGRTLALNLGFLLRLLIPAVLAFLPLVIFIIVSLNLQSDFYNSVLFLDARFLLTVLSAVILTLYAVRYFTVFTLYVENESLSNKELFKASKHIMRTRSGAAAKLIFSYTPWMLLCLTVLPILYVVPYMTQGLCIGAKWMTQAAYEGYEEA